MFLSDFVWCWKSFFFRNEHNQTNGMQWRLKQKFLKSNSEPSEPEDSAGSPEIQCVLKESEIDSAVDTSEVESSDVSKANSDFSVWKGKNQKSCSKYFDPICEECGLDFEDPTPSQLEIYLHAFTYKLMGYTFVAPLPHWALPYKEVIEECIPNLEAAVELKHEGKTISGSVKVPSVWKKLMQFLVFLSFFGSFAFQRWKFVNLVSIRFLKNLSWRLVFLTTKEFRKYLEEGSENSNY